MPSSLKIATCVAILSSSSIKNNQRMNKNLELLLGLMQCKYMYICIYNYTVQQYIYIIPYVYIRTVYTRLLENWAGSSFNFNVKIGKLTITAEADLVV